MPREKGIHYEMGTATDTGVVRTENQDSIDICYTADKAWRLMIVCDGMGGHAGGQKASSMAVKVIGEEFNRRIDDLNAHEALHDAIIEANRAIFQEAQRHPELKGMGTTCVVLAVKEDKAYIAHVGDSRIYRIRPKVVERMTKDHSSVQKLVDGGLLSEEEAEDHPDSNILHRCIGAREELEPEIKQEEHIEKGDRYLLCSDGLTSLVDDQIIAAMAMMCPPQEAVDKLIALAKDRGGHDNISVQILYRTGKHRPTGNFEPDSFRRLPKPVTRESVPLSSPVQEPEPVDEFDDYEEEALQAQPSRRREMIFFLIGLLVGALLTATVFIITKMVAADSGKPKKRTERPQAKTVKHKKREVEKRNGKIRVIRRYAPPVKPKKKPRSVDGEESFWRKPPKLPPVGTSRKRAAFGRNRSGRWRREHRDYRNADRIKSHIPGARSTRGARSARGKRGAGALGRMEKAKPNGAGSVGAEAERRLSGVAPGTGMKHAGQGIHGKIPRTRPTRVGGAVAPPTEVKSPRIVGTLDKGRQPVRPARQTPNARGGTTGNTSTTENQ